MMESPWTLKNYHNYSPLHARSHPMANALSPDFATLTALLASPFYLSSTTHTMSSGDRPSERSLSTSPSPTSSSRPRSRKPFPSLALAGAMSTALKSSLSPPSTTFTGISPSSSATSSALSPSLSTTSSELSLSSLSTSSSLSSPSFASCAYPDWPKRDILSPISSTSGNQASSYISDEDLLDLAQLDLCNNRRVPAGREEISWELTKQPPLVLHSLPVSQGASASPKRRRRSSPLKRRKMVRGMSPIAEAPE